MQSFSDLFANNRLLAVGIVLAAVAVILAVGVALFRLLFGRRLHMSGGRARQPRLGVVDAFDLDRQRQLVLIRRDNVEHLLMIGGPNDVLVEAAIVRAPVGVLGSRDKENGLGPTVGIPAPMPHTQAIQAPSPPSLPTAAASPAPESGPSLPFPAAMPSEPKVAVAGPEGEPPSPVPPGPAITAVAPQAAAQVPETRLPPAATLPPNGPRPSSPPARPATTLPPRPPLTPVPRPAVPPTQRTNFARATPIAPPPGPSPAAGPAPQPERVEPPLGRTAGDRPPTAGVDRSGPGSGREPAATPTPPVRAVRMEGASSLPTPPETSRSIPGEPPSAAPSGANDGSPAPVPPTASPQRPPPPQPRVLPQRASMPQPAQPRAPMPSLGSLEEEMAKLLGRPTSPPDQSGSGS